jgi:hypothetical protein
MFSQKIDLQIKISTFVCSSCVAVLADQYEGGQENRLDGASITRITKEGSNFGATGKAPTLTAIRIV